MKKRLIIGLLICSVIICIALPFSVKSYADPFTAGQIASTAYAMMQSWGVSFTAGNATAWSMNNFMAEQVEDYVNQQGGSIADVFIGEIAVDLAGKLVVGQQMYNSVVGFLDWLKDKYDLSTVDFSLSEGQYQGKYLPLDSSEAQEIMPGFSIVFSAPIRPPRLTLATIYQDGVQVWQHNTRYLIPETDLTGNWGLGVSGNNLVVRLGQTNSEGTATDAIYVYQRNVQVSNTLSWSVPDNWSMPTVLNPDQEWTGTIGGYSAPDTNLDQLLGDINQAVADNNLVVDGEVIDIPIPPPTPEPIDPDTPLSNVPWEGLDTNLTNLYNQGLEEIGAIGDAQDAITDSIGVQTGALEGAIADNAGVVSGAIDQAVSDIQDAIGDQTEALDQSLTTTAEGVVTIAEALEDETIDWQKFDLRGLFPFCIPFDIYNMLEALNASPSAPHVQLPFVIESIDFSYTIDLDFSAFDTVAAVMRQMELIVYGIALAWATSKVIKW